MRRSNRSMTSQRSNRSKTSLLQRAKVKVARAQLKLKYLEQAQVLAHQLYQIETQLLMNKLKTEQQVQTQLLMNKLKTERELEETNILISVLSEDDSKVHANSTLVKTKLSADADAYVPLRNVNISVSASNPVVSISTQCTNNTSIYCTQTINQAIVSNTPVTSQSLQSNINPCTSAEVTFNNPVMYDKPISISGTMNTTSSSMLHNNILTASTSHLTHHFAPVPGNIDTSTQHDLSHTQHLHVSSAEFASCSSGTQSHSSPSVVFSSSPSETVCSTLDTTQDFVDNCCISSGSDNNVNCEVPDSDHQSQSFHIQDSSIPSTDLPPHCQDSSIPQHIDLDQSKISQVDISKDSSVSNTISTEEVLVIEGQFNDVPSSCSRSCYTEFPPSHVLCPTPESDTEVIKLCSLQDKQLVRLFDEDKKELLLSPSTVIPNYVPDVVCGENNEGVSTHVISSNVVTFPSHSDSFDRSSQFCYVICAQKTDLARILTVSFSFMKSVIFVLPLGFVDSDRRYLKKKRKVR